MTIETSVDALTVQTSALLDVCVSLQNNVAKQISDAVTLSVNSAQIPLVSMAQNLIDTQTMLITYISR